MCIIAGRINPDWKNELQKTVVEKKQQNCLAAEEENEKNANSGAQLPPDYQVKTYPKKDAKKND